MDKGHYSGEEERDWQSLSTLLSFPVPHCEGEEKV